MKIGYARVSTADQHLRMQEDALRSAGCEEIYTDVISGVKSHRPGLNKALSYLREGDTLIVWKLDRLGRSIQPRKHRYLHWRRQTYFSYFQRVGRV